MAHQEIADLSRISHEFSHRLMNSTSTLFAFLQKVPQTSDLIASISGTKTTLKVTEQAQSNWLFGDEKTGMKSIREVDEFIRLSFALVCRGLRAVALVLHWF